MNKNKHVSECVYQYMYLSVKGLEAEECKRVMKRWGCERYDRDLSAAL